MSQGEIETETTDADVERRRLIKMGAVGAAAAGAVVAGGPQVLGMGESAPYAGAASPEPPDTTLPPDQSLIAAQVNLKDSNGVPIDLDQDYTGITASLYDAATGGNVLATVAVTAESGKSNIAWAFFNLSAGTYWVEMHAPAQAIATALGYTTSTESPSGRQQVIVTSVSQGYTRFVTGTLT